MEKKKKKKKAKISTFFLSNQTPGGEGRREIFTLYEFMYLFRLRL